MSYSLRRTRDGAGDSGLMSDALVPVYDDHNNIVDVTVEHNARPRVGVAMKVGSHYARTYSRQDYWRTTIITDILEDTGDVVNFKTGNSEYVWTDGFTKRDSNEDE